MGYGFTKAMHRGESICMEGNIGRGKHWQIDSFRAFGERKFGKLIDQPIDY